MQIIFNNMKVLLAWLKKFPNILFLFFIMFVIYNIINKERSINKFAKYSICYTTKVDREGRGVTSIYYYFQYLGTKYEDDDSFRKGIKAPNGRYYVKFSAKNPKYSRLTYIPVPDSINVAPPGGWAKIPH